jgi:hypothetical protein
VSSLKRQYDIIISILWVKNQRHNKNPVNSKKGELAEEIGWAGNKMKNGRDDWI